MAGGEQAEDVLCATCGRGARGVLGGRRGTHQAPAAWGAWTKRDLKWVFLKISQLDLAGMAGRPCGLGAGAGREKGIWAQGSLRRCVY